MRSTHRLLIVLVLGCISFVQTANASLCTSQNPENPCFYNLTTDFELCLRAARWTGNIFVWKGTAATNGYVKEAKRRGLDCTKDINFYEFNSNPYTPSASELQAELDKEADALRKKKKQAAVSQAQAENKVRYNKRLQKDKCLLELSERSSEQNQAQADYFCNIIAETEGNKIFFNCMMEKGANKNRRLIDAAINVCADIAVNPSGAEILKYNIPSWLFPQSKD